MSLIAKILLLFYQIFSTLLLPIFFLIIIFRKSQNKECSKNYLQKFAITNFDKNLLQENKLIWVHAVSVGESNSAWNLIDEILKNSPNNRVLFTTTTLTSANLIKQKILVNSSYQGQVIHQFFPLDSYFVVKKFLKFWSPRACIFLESELWPNYLMIAKKLQILCYLVNARISKKSLNKWQKIGKIGFNIFDYFSLIFAQNEENKINIQKFTKQEVCCYGNLKSQSSKLPINEKLLNDLQSQIGKRKIFMAVSTHSGEESQMIEVHKKIKQFYPDLLSIIIIRHPQRANEVMKLLSNENFILRSKNQTISQDTEFYIVDTIGEVGTFLSLVNAAFIGGSLVDVGGHNPFELLRMGCLPISGNKIYNFLDVYHEIINNNAGIIVKDCQQLIEEFIKLSNNQELLQTMIDNGSSLIKQNNLISQNIINNIFNHIKNIKNQ